ncbi:hypothetical protein FQN50_000693 [Emmonsiellopsis sp. PD_5]|nr:hypothetical protein FQN50_000693 [Emmonsiellopsis sp. PD_5]
MADPKAPKKPNGLISTYLLFYNALSFILWATVTVRAFTRLARQPTRNVPAIFDAVFPLLLRTQSLALMEILHSLAGLVRASVVTTAMQVASRILVVWGVLYLFAGEGLFGTTGEVGEVVKVGDWAFVGCVSAWGITECIRYGFFALQVMGAGVPGWMSWLRYNTFFVLYPIGISSECTLIYQAIAPAKDVHPALPWFFIAVLVIYVPGSYILYTHMMSQRRKVMRAVKAKRAD